VNELVFIHALSAGFVHVKIIVGKIVSSMNIHPELREDVFPKES